MYSSSSLSSHFFSPLLSSLLTSPPLPFLFSLYCWVLQIHHIWTQIQTLNMTGNIDLRVCLEIEMGLFVRIMAASVFCASSPFNISPPPFSSSLPHPPPPPDKHTRLHHELWLAVAEQQDAGFGFDWSKAQSRWWWSRGNCRKKEEGHAFFFLRMWTVTSLNLQS